MKIAQTLNGSFFQSQNLKSPKLQKYFIRKQQHVTRMHLKTKCRFTNFFCLVDKM